MTPDSRRRTPRNLRSRSVLAGQAARAAAEMESAMQPASEPTVAAFFDVDNTVVRGASIYHLARGLHRRHFFSTRDIARAAWQQTYFRVAGVEDPQHIATARASALTFIRGRTVDEVRSVGEEVFDDHIADNIWPGTHAITHWHLDHGHRVWLVTAAPIEIAEVIARRLGLTGALGTEAEHIDGVYTGQLRDELLHGARKADAVRRIAAAEGLDLDRCYAYSDSVNDLPLLSAVGNPRAINPDRRLRAHAQSHDWPVHDYRTGRRMAAHSTVIGAGALLAATVWRHSRRRR